MTRRWAPQTRYTLHARKTKGLVYDTEQLTFKSTQIPMANYTKTQFFVVMFALSLTKIKQEQCCTRWQTTTRPLLRCYVAIISLSLITWVEREKRAVKKLCDYWKSIKLHENICQHCLITKYHLKNELVFLSCVFDCNNTTKWFSINELPQSDSCHNDYEFFNIERNFVQIECSFSNIGIRIAKKNNHKS